MSTPDKTKDPVRMVYKMLDEKKDKRHRNWLPPAVRFRASEAGACSRQIWYRLSGMRPLKEEGRMELFSQDGDICHDSVRMNMRDAGVHLDGLAFMPDGSVKELIDIRSTIEHNGEALTIAGRADGIVFIEMEDGAPVPYYLEIKSIDGWSSKYINDAAKRGELLEYLKEKRGKYLSQSHLMSFLIREHDDWPDVAGTYLVIKDRSLCQIGHGGTGEQGLIPYDDSSVQGTLNKFAMIKRKLREGEPPIREHVKSSKECGYCQFREYCWKETE